VGGKKLGISLFVARISLLALGIRRIKTGVSDFDLGEWKIDSSNRRWNYVFHRLIHVFRRKKQVSG